jgi:hypothetical protein
MWSFHLWAGTRWLQGVLFFSAAIAAFLLLVGYKTRIAVLISWLLLTSTHNRFFDLQQGGDFVLRILIFWSIFLPLGSAYSIDGRLKATEEKKPRRVLSLATTAILLQVAFIYLFTAISKSRDVWWFEGSTLHYALNIDQYTKPLGYVLLSFTSWLPLFSRIVFILEVFAFLLLFFPLFTAPVRMITILLMIGLHMGMGASMKLGPFPWVMTAGLLLFVPSWAWEMIRKKTKNLNLIDETFITKKLKPLTSISRNGKTDYSQRLLKIGYGLTNSLLAIGIIVMVWWNPRSDCRPGCK